MEAWASPKDQRSLQNLDLRSKYLRKLRSFDAKGLTRRGVRRIFPELGAKAIPKFLCASCKKNAKTVQGKPKHNLARLLRVRGYENGRFSGRKTVVSDSERVRKRTGTKKSVRATLRGGIIFLAAFLVKIVLVVDCHLLRA